MRGCAAPDSGVGGGSGARSAVHCDIGVLVEALTAAHPLSVGLPSTEKTNAGARRHLVAHLATLFTRIQSKSERDFLTVGGTEPSSETMVGDLDRNV